MPYFFKALSSILKVFDPAHTLGVRAVGTANIVPTLAAIANAINNILNIRLHSIPMKPDAVLHAIKSNNNTC